jgi:hypothetical protein
MHEVDIQVPKSFHRHFSCELWQVLIQLFLMSTPVVAITPPLSEAFDVRQGCAIVPVIREVHRIREACKRKLLLQDVESGVGNRDLVGFDRRHDI